MRLAVWERDRNRKNEEKVSKKMRMKGIEKGDNE